MKKFTPFLLLLIIHTGCAKYGQVRYDTNSQNNGQTLTMLYKHTSVENQSPEVGKFISISTYYRKILSKEKTPIRITLKIDAIASFNSFKSEGFIRVNQKTFQIILTDITGEQREKSRNISTKDGKTTLIKTMRGTFTLPENVEKQITFSQFFALRVYIDSRPVTFIFKHKTLQDIKSFCGATADYVPR